MNLRTSIIAAAAGAAVLLATSCVGPEGAYMTAGGPGYMAPRPYSNYTVTYGTGYAGRGYYYGPPNLGYYSRSPGVVYYSSRTAVPSHYWPSSSPYYRAAATTSTYRTPSSRWPASRTPTSYRDNDRWDGRRDGDRDGRWDGRRGDDQDRWDGRGDRDDDRDRTTWRR